MKREEAIRVLNDITQHCRYDWTNIPEAVQLALTALTQPQLEELDKDRMWKEVKDCLETDCIGTLLSLPDGLQEEDFAGAASYIVDEVFSRFGQPKRVFPEEKVRKEIEQAYTSGYERGHDDTVESSYGGIEEKAEEYANDFLAELRKLWEEEK